MQYLFGTIPLHNEETEALGGGQCFSTVRGLLVLELDLHLLVSKKILFIMSISRQVLRNHLTPER